MGGVDADFTADGLRLRSNVSRAPVPDAARSSHADTAWRYGHQWVALAVLVEFPLASRRWALPVPVGLYRTPEVGKAEGVRHRTPAPLMCRPLRRVLLRFPGRAFAFSGAPGYGAHEVARSCHHRRGRLTPVSELHPDANLHDPPAPHRGGVGRPQVRGPRVPKPGQAVAAATAFAPP